VLGMREERGSDTRVCCPDAWAECKSSAFHEGRGAGKKDPPGGHILVSGKKLVTEKNSLAGMKDSNKTVFGRQACYRPIRPLGTGFSILVRV
jgi:hypothetical protein